MWLDAHPRPQLTVEIDACSSGLWSRCLGHQVDLLWIVQVIFWISRQSTYIHSMQLSWPLLKKSQAWTWRPLGPLLPLTLLMETPLGLWIDSFHSFCAWLLRLLPFGAALTKFSNELTHSKHQASKVNCWITRQSLQRTSVCVCVMEECGRPFVFLPSTVSILCPVFVRLLKLQSCTANCVILVSPFLPSSCFLVAGDCTGIVPSCGAA